MTRADLADVAVGRPSDVTGGPLRDVSGGPVCDVSGLTVVQRAMTLARRWRRHAVQVDDAGITPGKKRSSLSPCPQ
jgi:hypothetical protein